MIRAGELGGVIRVFLQRQLYERVKGFFDRKNRVSLEFVVQFVQRREHSANLGPLQQQE